MNIVNKNNHIHEVRSVYGYFFMKKLRCLVLVILLVLVQCATNVCTVSAETQTQQLQENKLYSKSCAMTDGASGRLLYGKEEDIPLPNASTTKIMTCILAMESCAMDEVVTFSEEAAAQPKVHLGAKKGEQFYLQDLLYGLMLESYNDCACAIAEHVGGTVEKFAEKMNERAKELGCVDTHFVTPNGLDCEDEEGAHHTTAYDLCKIMAYCAWGSPVSAQFLSLTQTKSHSFNSLSGTGYAVSNKNVFLDMMDCAITGKTGYTAKAGYCYVAAVEEGGRRYCIALLACGWPNHKNYRWSDAKQLFQYGLDNYHLYKGTEDAFEVSPIEVPCGYRDGTLAEWGDRTKLSLIVDKKEKNPMFLKADWDEAQIRKEFTQVVTLPVKKGSKIGRIEYCINGEEIYSFDICAGEDIKKWDFRTFFMALWKEFLL